MFNRRPETRKLKQQPKMQRVNAAYAPAPRLVLPRETVQAARQRQKSQSRLKFRWPTQLLWRIVTSPRWISLGVLALAVYALVLVGGSATFYLTAIPVEGVYSVAAEEVVSASGLAGQHIFAADPARAAEAIAQVPGVISAEVELSWPNVVHIRITEDAPIAIWRQGEESFWINQQGGLMPARLNVPGLLTIESDTAEVVMGRTLSEPTEEGAVAEVIHLGRVPEDILRGALLLNQMFPEQMTIRYGRVEGFIYSDPRGWDVYLGTGDDMAQKLAVYEALVEDLRQRDLTPTYVSVSNQKKPYYRAISN